MPDEFLDPEIRVARMRQAAALPAFDVTIMSSAEGRAAANAAALSFNDGTPAISDVREIAIASPSGEIRGRLYRPNVETTGAILYVHGGGWFNCNVDTHDRLMRVLARDSGHAVLGIDYRLAPEDPYPAGLNDVLAAWQWLCAGAPSLGFTRLAMAGDSAGANLALAACVSLRDNARTLPMALVLFYGCYAPDFETNSHRRLGDGRYGLSTARMRWYWQNYVGSNLDGVQHLAAPLHADLNGLPPTYLNLAALDPLSDDTRALAANLRGADVETILKEWAGACHGFMQMTRDVDLARRAAADAGRFLAQKLASVTPSSDRH